VRPTTRELLERVATALEHEVLPSLQDKWAASVLRSAVQLLGHAAVRAQDEPRILVEHIADARSLLETVAPRLDSGRAEIAALRDAVSHALQIPDAAAHDVAALDAQDESLQAVIELLLRQRDALCATTNADLTHADVLDCLRRRLAREHHLYFPAFISAPF
jgi:hypothetical protein